MLNGKNAPALRFGKKRRGPPTIDPKNTTNKIEVYHPTKGWRLMSPKRMRAASLMAQTNVRGHAIKKIIAQGHNFGGF